MKESRRLGVCHMVHDAECAVHNVMCTTQPVCLTACLFAFLPASQQAIASTNLSACLFACLPGILLTCLPACPPACLRAYPPANLLAYLPAYPPACLRAYPPANLLAYLPACLCGSMNVTVNAYVARNMRSRNPC